MEAIMTYKTGPSPHRARERERVEREKIVIHQFIVWPLNLCSLFVDIQECRKYYTKAPTGLMVF